MGAFIANYSAGGTLDKIKLINLIKDIENLNSVEKVQLIEALETVKKVENVTLIDSINDLKKVDEVGKIKGFATRTQPYNIMKAFSIPALNQSFEFEFEVSDCKADILALTLTCSGYGESDHYDLFFNEQQWFKDWYCSEVKDGLFLGTSTYVYDAPENSKIRLVFKNESATQKTVWLGVRMLID